MPTESSCSELFSGSGQTMAGSAPRSTGWLLITDPGPWAPQPFTEHRTETAAATTIASRAAHAGLRPLLIRRYGREHSRSGFAVVDSRTLQWARHEDTSMKTVADSAWDTTTHMPTPWFLICTHGTRDVCCAVRGRPVAAAFHSLRPQTSWECSHVGGHRFATNVVVLPYGLVYGNVSPDDVPRIIDASEQGRFVPHLLRGRCTESEPIQTARRAASLASGLWGINDLTVTATHDVDGGSMVSFGSRVGDINVTVDRQTHSVVASCGAAAGDAITWHARVQ